MAKIYKNDKGFKVIRTESMSEALKLGGMAICDSCNKSNYTGYYVAVLNSWYCDKCFDEWYQRAKYYQKDADIEKINFHFNARLLGLIQ